jgi:hypothetical protein
MTMCFGGSYRSLVSVPAINRTFAKLPCSLSPPQPGENIPLRVRAEIGEKVRNSCARWVEDDKGASKFEPESYRVS